MLLFAHDVSLHFKMVCLDETNLVLVDKDMEVKTTKGNHELVVNLHFGMVMNT